MFSIQYILFLGWCILCNSLEHFTISEVMKSVIYGECEEWIFSEEKIYWKRNLYQFLTTLGQDLVSTSQPSLN